MLKLVISDDDGKNTVVPLVRDEITIGRKEGNTIRLTERNVSRRHARLSRLNGHFTIEDLHSYNGVLVNGKRIGGELKLGAGDQIQIGDYQLALQLDSADTATIPQTSSPGVADADTALLASPGPPARLVMITPPAPGAEFALTQEKVRVGRAEDLGIWVNHRSISREHAEIQKEADGLRLIDLGSANGVRVNGEDVQNRLLQPGDVVELGQVRFRFVPAGEHYAFDNDQTMQMDAVSLEPTKSNKTPLMIGLAILLLAIVGAVVLAIGPEAPGTGPTAGPVISDPVAPPVDPVAAAQPTADQRYEEAVAACAAAITEGNVEQAFAHAATALGIRPEDVAATECQGRASTLRSEEESFARGLQAYEQDQLTEAYFAFEELSVDSPLRDRPEVAANNTRLAAAQLEAGRGALDRDATEALRLARFVQDIPGISDGQRAVAESLARTASQAGGEQPVAAAPPRTRHPRRNPRRPRPTTPRATTPSPTPAATAAAGPSVMDRVRNCSGNNRCIISALRGHDRSPSELAMLIETYRAVGDVRNARRQMVRYVDRYPSARRASNYRQFIARQP